MLIPTFMTNVSNYHLSPFFDSCGEGCEKMAVYALGLASTAIDFIHKHGALGVERLD